MSRAEKVFKVRGQSSKTKIRFWKFHQHRTLNDASLNRVQY